MTRRNANQSRKQKDEQTTGEKYPLEFITIGRPFRTAKGRKLQQRKKKVPTKESVLEKICGDLNVATDQLPKVLTTVAVLSRSTRDNIQFYSKGHGGTLSTGSGLAMLGIKLSYDTARKEEFTKYVTINHNGHRRGYWVPTADVAGKALESYFSMVGTEYSYARAMRAKKIKTSSSTSSAKTTAAAKSAAASITMTELKGQPKLRRLLKLYSLGVNKKISLEFALNKLGVQYDRELRGITPEYARQAIGALFSESECRRVYTGYSDIFDVRANYRETKTSAGEVLRALRAGRVKDPTDPSGKKKLTLDSLLHDMHPELQQQYSVPLETFLDNTAIPREVISAYLMKRSLEGKSLAFAQLQRGDARDKRFVAAIEYHRNLINRQIIGENDANAKAAVAAKAAATKAAAAAKATASDTDSQANKDQTLETIVIKPLLSFNKMVDMLNTSEHISQNHVRANQTAAYYLADAMQGFVYMLLTIASKYDRDGTAMGPQFRKMFGRDISQVWFETQGTQDREYVRLASQTDANIFADGRIATASGNSLIEVKFGYGSATHSLLDSLKKYSGRNFWSSINPNSMRFGAQGELPVHEKIAHRIAVMHMDQMGFEQVKPELLHQGWIPVSSRNIALFLRKAAALVQEKDPELFSRLPFPLATPNRLAQLYQLVQSKSHVYNSDGFTKSMQWLRNMLTDNAKAIAAGSFYHPQQSVPLRTTFAAKDVDPAYRSVDWESAGRAVAIDIEALSFHDREPIVSISLAYVREKKAFVDVYFARDPLEEGLILSEVKRRTTNKKIITFRGKYYDGRVINGRAAYHRIGPIVDPSTLASNGTFAALADIVNKEQASSSQADVQTASPQQMPYLEHYESQELNTPENATQRQSANQPQNVPLNASQSIDGVVASHVGSKTPGLSKVHAGSNAQSAVKSKERELHVDIAFGKDGYQQFTRSLGSATSTLQHFERYILGLQRENDLSGAHVAPTYANYLRNHDHVGNAERIVLHNGIDALSTLAGFVAQKEGFDKFREYQLRSQQRRARQMHA